MKILRAETMGFCFGVRDAIKVAMNYPQPYRMTVLGELVHNEEIMIRLTERGVRMLPETQREVIPETPAVMITAHGMSDRERRLYEEAGREIIDTTCPLVRRIHKAALMLAADGRTVVVIGKPNHVEVRGIVGDLKDYAVFACPEDVTALAAMRIGVICQSTMPPNQAQAVLQRIKEVNAAKDIRYIPTICKPTLDRQAAAHRLLVQVDTLVVVGGRHSNNTLELVKLAEVQGIRAIHVQTQADLRMQQFEGAMVVGLTGGTSTPDETIEAVYDWLMALSQAEEHAVREIA